MIALDMIFARPTSAFKLTPIEDEEAHGKDDIAIFPIATPLLAGPGAMSAVILMAAGAADDPVRYTGVFAALAAVMLLTLVLLLAANELSRALGVTAQRVSDAGVRHPARRHRGAGRFQRTGWQRASGAALGFRAGTGVSGRLTPGWHPRATFCVLS